MQTTVQSSPGGSPIHDDARGAGRGAMSSAAISSSPTTGGPGVDLHTQLVNRISWGAVLAGVVLMLSAHIILNMLGVGLGAATLDPQGGDNPSVGASSITAGIWWAVVGIIASFIGAMVAGRLSGSTKASTGGYHGLTAWALTLLVMAYLFSSAASSVAGGAFSAVSSTMSGMGRSVGAVAQTAAQTAAPSIASATDPFGRIEQQLRNSGNDPAALRDGAVAAMRALVTGDAAQAGEARERAAEAMARAQSIPIEEARTRVAQLEQQYRQTAEQARTTALRAAETVTRTVSTGMLLASLALLLGAAAAWFGGRMGVVDPEVTRIHGGPTSARA